MNRSSGFPLLTHAILLIRIHLREALGRSSLDGMLLWAALIGVVGGASSALFREAAIGLEWLMTGRTADLVSVATSLPAEKRVWVPALGGLLAGSVLALGARLFRRGRAVDYLEAVNVGDGHIPVGPTLGRLISSLCSVGSGSSIGREGGMVQFSALLASSFGGWCGLSRPRLRLLVACGGAAGIASAYNTPLAGALFIAEIVLQSLSIEILGPLVVASVLATLTIRQWIGLRPIFEAPDFGPLPGFGILPVLGLGLAAGMLAPLFLVLLERSRRMFRWSRLPLPLSLGLGGVLVGLISVAEPGVWGNGHAVVDALLNGAPERHAVASLLLLKILATAVAVGSGAVGGVFTPTLLIGAAIGWLFGGTAQAWLPDAGATPVTYAVLGMGAFLAGTTHAPVMAILMVFEMTLDADLLFPLIVASIAARYLSAAIRPKTVYADALGEESQTYPWSLQVSALLLPPGPAVGLDESMAAACRLFSRKAIHHLWVVDAGGSYRGAIALQAMRQFAGRTGKAREMSAADCLENALPTVSAESSLADALALFERTGAEKLPVVDEDGALVGEISQVDVLLSFKQL
ncbi:MAG: ClcB-like voltage-gated chloride channel protein [Methylococcus sp.]|nr:ClcB-like voltage-gated chloride channel protein [Methylococcus sp.]